MANELFKELNEQSENIYFIHYSCENLNDENAGYSPRITSIAILHSNSNQMSSFSMHLVAEEMHIARDEISHRYDEIERLMLERFFTFVKSRCDKAQWVHWNMNNINFGFEALEHRYRILTENEPFHINERCRWGLPTLLFQKYGRGYAKDPKMVSLMELNGGKHRDVLTGTEEVSAFKAGEFAKMHKSTMQKVYFFKHIFTLMNANKLHTETNQWKYRINLLYQSPIVQLVSIAGVIGTIISLLVAIL